jgi:alkylhydroperoxidase/carboxymuconolactone decarboxylase family protein YurZ
MNAQSGNNENPSLDARQQCIVTISALTAQGNVAELSIALHRGLDVSLTINEIKEELVQLYAYCGFPRSLNGISTFKKVVEERKAKNIHDVTGKQATLLKDNLDKYERGRKTLETLTKIPQAKPAPGFGEFAPRIDAFLKEHLFADIFESDVLTFQQRELVTIAALGSMEGVEGQLQAHISMGMNVGLSEHQILEMFSIIEKHIGKKLADIDRATLSKVVSSRKQ